MEEDVDFQSSMIKGTAPYLDQNVCKIQISPHQHYFFMTRLRASSWRCQHTNQPTNQQAHHFHSQCTPWSLKPCFF